MSTPEASTIEIPRLEGETPRAYAARVEYLTMGAGRSLGRLAERGQSAGKARATQRLATLEAWSAKYGWQRSAELYDQAMVSITVQRHRAEYDKALEDHRKKVLEKTERLSKILDGLEAQVMRALTGAVIEGKDGKTYYIPKMGIEIGAVTALMRGRLTVADMEAHALDIPGLRAALLEGGDQDA